MRKLSNSKKYGITGWLFLLPAAILICFMSFRPIFQAFIISLKSGIGNNMEFAGEYNYLRMLLDKTLHTAIMNTLVYMLQVPIMLGLALWLATLLNEKGLRFKGLFRILLFVPCATASVSYSLVFRIMFAADGMINTFLVKSGILQTGYNFFGHPWSARMIILLALIWRWTGYNMVFLLAALQNIDEGIYESAILDGASRLQIFTKITIPLIKPTLILLMIMTVNGSIQLYDESVNLTGGGPANTTLSISHYIYNLSFQYTPNFGYSTAISFVIFVVVAILSLIQMKVGDKRD
jgi:lactose/L-arabinose transport system permease protein